MSIRGLELRTLQGEHVVVTGGSRVVREMREVADAGAELILVNPLFDEVEQMERLLAEVVPRPS